MIELSSGLGTESAPGNMKISRHLPADRQESSSSSTAGWPLLDCSQVVEIKFGRIEALESNSVRPKTDVSIASFGVLLEADALC